MTKVVNLYKLVILSVLIISIFPIHATHLVGGEMNYEYLGNEEYLINLTVYRDCYLGEAEYDYPAYVLVYDGDGNFRGYFPVVGEPETNLTIEMDNECYVAPPNVCVEKKIYSFVGELPRNESGYHLSYQRCCRNRSIVNIIDDKSNDPGDSGMNLHAYIPSLNLIENSNPVFKVYPPVAICANHPLVFDHSATDVDGDSLVYKLCMPTDALTPLSPAYNGYNQDALPFADVRFRYPYSLEDVMGGEYPLSIDNKTGLLTGHPTKIGQYVVGVCAEEYRDGEMISVTKRDFQFNVAECGKISVASFFSYDTICNSLEVEFHNQSEGADSYQWIFDDGNSYDTDDVSHEFSDYGTYNVTLIAKNITGCADTATKTIVLQEEVFSFNTEDVVVCSGENAFLQITTQPENMVNNVFWQTKPPVYSKETELTYSPKESETVNFEISTVNGCKYSGAINITVAQIPDVHIIASEKLIFVPKFITVSASNASSDFIYLWEADGYMPSTSGSQASVQIDHSQWVYLTAIDARTMCQVKDSIFIEFIICDLIEKVQISNETILHCDYPELKLSAGSDNPDISISWIWDNETLEEENLSFNLQYDSLYSYQLVISQEDFCNDTIEYLFNTSAPLSVSSEEIVICEGTDTEILSLGIETDFNYTVVLSTGDTLVNTDKFEFTPEENSEIFYSIYYGEDCVIEGVVPLILDQLHVKAFADPPSVAKGGSTILSAVPDDLHSYIWYPSEIPESPFQPQTVAIPDETTEFILVATSENGCITTDTILVEVSENRCSEEYIFIPTAFTPNNDGVNDIWQIRTEIPVEIVVAVYNRWGEKVFESNNVEKGWDGTYKGRAAESGTYAYYLTVICEDKKQYFSKGNITLIR